MKPGAPSMKKMSVDFSALAEEFKHLNPNDVGTWPLVPKVAALIALFVLTLAAGWWFVWSDQLAELESKQKKEEELKTEYVDKKRQAVNLDLYRQQLKEIDQTFGALLKQLPGKSEMEALLTEINQAGLGRGLLFDSFIPGKEQVKEFYAEMPVTLKLSGSYHDFGAFAADIAKLPRIVTLNNVVIAPSTSGKMVMDAEARTFRYLDEEELAKSRQAAKAGKPGGAK